MTMTGSTICSKRAVETHAASKVSKNSGPTSRKIDFIGRMGVWHGRFLKNKPQPDSEQFRQGLRPENIILNQTDDA